EHRHEIAGRVSSHIVLQESQGERWQHVFVTPDSVKERLVAFVKQNDRLRNLLRPAQAASVRSFHPDGHPQSKAGNKSGAPNSTVSPSQAISRIARGDSYKPFLLLGDVDFFFLVHMTKENHQRTGAKNDRQHDGNHTRPE